VVETVIHENLIGSLIGTRNDNQEGIRLTKPSECVNL